MVATPRNTASRKVLLAMIATLVLAGCGASDSTETTTPRDRADGLPIGNIVDTASNDLELLAEAENLILADCMAERGFTSIESPIRYDSTGSFNFERRYYVRTLEQAETIGYRPLNADELLTQLEVDESVENQSPEYYDALLGETLETEGDLAPDGTGCGSIAAVAIYGHQDRRLGFDGWSTLMQMGDDAYNATATSESVGEAEDAWSQCMAEAGYDFSKPQDAIDRFASNPSDWQGPLTDAERETAVADVTCRDTGNLDQIYFETESAAQLDRLEDQPELALTISTQVEAAVERAKETLEV